jgi:N-acetylgalactosamine kinase
MILLSLQGRPVDRLALADLLAEAETYVGTRGGGMDQAVCLMGENSRAVRVSFDPLAVRPVGIPDDWRFVIADSGVRASKAQAPQYNLRAAECRMGAALLTERTDMRLAEVPERERTAAFLDEVLPDRGYHIDEVAARVGLAPAELIERFLMGPDGSSLAEPDGGFPLRRRVDHVFSEARRVEEACRAMARGDLPRMGALMNESHASCRDRFEISCPELDSLTSRALDLGAAGSRLTGAGFGGCTVTLATEEQADGVASGLGRAFVCAPGGRADVVGKPGQLGLV